MSYLLDTNIVSLAIKKNSQITEKLEDIKAQKKRALSVVLLILKLGEDF